MKTMLPKDRELSKTGKQELVICLRYVAGSTLVDIRNVVYLLFLRYQGLSLVACLRSELILK